MNNAERNFDKRNAELAARLRPMDDKSEKVRQAHREWYQRELQRPGAHITTQAPEEVETALAQLRQKRFNAGREYYVSQEVAIVRETEAWTTEIAELLEPLVEKIEAFKQWQQARDRFAGACGMPRPMLADLATVEPTPQGFRFWRDRVQRVLHPPVKQARVPASENRLDLSGVLS